MSKGLPPKDSDFSAWYNAIVSKADLAEHGPVKGTMVIKPYGFQLWDNIKEIFDKMIKATGHTNAYFPLFIPKSYLAQEAEHVDGFAKECAVVTHTRLKADPEKGIIVDPESKLEEEVIVRPTSETIIWAMYKKWIQSYRDLPILINQWANVVRWEMRTRLFLRTSEFLWQEGHTAHATAEEAQKETLDILELYRQLAEDYLAMPVLTGFKSEAEKFAGANKTYCIEAMMGDKKALQAGTSHNLGQNFAKAFDVRFQTKENTEAFVYATSWGVSTRLVGAVIMAHGDDKGLRLPPKIAPIQVVIIPIARDEAQAEMVKKYLQPVRDSFEEKGIRYHEDWTDRSPGFKFNEWEMKGVPVRIEIGPRDLEKHQAMVARRDTSEKQALELTAIADEVRILLDDIHKNLFDKAQKVLDNCIVKVDNLKDAKKAFKDKKIAFAPWCGSVPCEDIFKEKSGAKSLNSPEEQPKLKKGQKCSFCKEEAKYWFHFGKSY